MKTLLTFFMVSAITCTIIFPQNSINKSGSKLKKDWSYEIDTTWGTGLSTEQKQLVFNTWWNRIDRTWGGFPNIKDEWDSLKIFYYPIISSGISNGRFQGILSRFTRSLKEAHSYISNLEIDSIFNIFEHEFAHFPSFPSFQYKPGIPALHLSAIFNRNYFGAGVTAYNDSIALVYSVMPNHPLNLQPGDIILGYDGIPWKDNLQDLLNQNLPLIYGGFLMGSSEESIKHLNTSSVGLNWGLFNTIDILKYSTGYTVHYPTSLLNNITWPYPTALPVREQLPVNGVPFVDNDDPTPVVWGIVEGTSTGYIYVYLWSDLTPVQTLFRNAVDSLMHVHNITGLIIDFRLNGGGQQFTANDGFKYLFNEDPTPYFCDYVRNFGEGHYNFHYCSYGMISEAFFSPNSELFDHPIAVLTGPECLSWGDMNAFRLRFHPMTRFFGKGTNGGFVTYDNWTNVPFALNNYRGMIYTGSVFSNYNNEGFMIHKGNPVDEKIWFTPAGVASGQDEIVNRALEWINNKVYPHDTKTDAKNYSPGAGNVTITTIIENPNSHQLNAKGYVHTTGGVPVNSVDLMMIPGGQTWVGSVPVPTNVDFFKVSVSVFDETASDTFTVPNAARFTTAGPVVLDSTTYLDYGNYYCKFFITNLGDSIIPNVKVLIKNEDSCVISINPSSFTFNSLPPGVSTGTNYFIISVKPDCLVDSFLNVKVEIGKDNWFYWEDTTGIPLGVSLTETGEIPTEFSLLQNYPNPFNPVTLFRYSIPNQSKVVFKVFDILGTEIETLINEEQAAGIYELKWNAANLPSGVYFYYLKAGDFIQSKKMILIK